MDGVGGRGRPSGGCCAPAGGDGVVGEKILVVLRAPWEKKEGPEKKQNREVGNLEGGCEKVNNDWRWP